MTDFQVLQGMTGWNPPSNTVGCTQDRSDPNIRSLQEKIGRSDRPHSPYLSRSRNV